jgi:hypothetical protein
LVNAIHISTLSGTEASFCAVIFSNAFGIPANTANTIIDKITIEYDI